jgi:NADH:ubiquinone oxidoreductase subunit 3 (subunit A)
MDETMGTGDVIIGILAVIGVLVLIGVFVVVVKTVLLKKDEETD